jgi:hypothetical protein
MLNPWRAFGTRCGWTARRSSIDATSSISARLSVRITPACWKRASTVTSEAASIAPVWELVARAPAAERPLFTTTIGFTLPTRGATREKRRGQRNRPFQMCPENVRRHKAHKNASQCAAGGNHQIKRREIFGMRPLANSSRTGPSNSLRPLRISRMRIGEKD